MDCAQVLRRPPCPTVPRPHSVHVSPQKHPSFGPAGTPSKHRLDVILPSLYTQWPSRRFESPPSSYAWSYEIRPRRLLFRGLSTVVARPIKFLRAFVNDAAEAGQTQISLSLGLVSGYGIAVPPMAADLSLVFHHGPTRTQLYSINP